MTKLDQKPFTGRSGVLSVHLNRRVVLTTLSAVVTLSILALYPMPAKAGIFADLKAALEGKAEAAQTQGKSVQSMPLPKPAMNIDPNPAKGGGGVAIEDGSAARAQGGFSGQTVVPQKDAISIYVVREGDTLSEIAEMFGVSTNTIIWANDLPVRGTVRVGQRLTILPVTGLKYTVKKGDTLASVAKEHHGDADEIAQYNDIVGELKVGTEILIPNGEEHAAPAAKTVAKVPPTGGSSGSYSGYFMRPVTGAVRTQGIHGSNGVDLGAPVGTPILASAAGDVIISKEGGWNGGYGSYVVIKHDNGTQTLYAHQSSVIVGVGQTVVQGQVIGYVGSTGQSSGPHLHFEIRGGPRNPF